MEQTFGKDILVGKVAIITGGARGMLNKIAETFLRQGASVAILSRKEADILAAVEKLKASTGSQKCIAVKCDVRDYKVVEQAVDKVIETFGRADILINGAAGNFLAGLDSLSSNAFKTVIEIDTVGTFHMSKAVYTKWQKKNGGNIVNISATLHYSGTAMQMHAGAAKAAVDALTKHLAVELGPKGVRVNGIAPGPIGGTEGMDRLSGKPGDAPSIETTLPLQRMGTVEDIASMTLFLVSPAASYVTGQTIVVDGGQVLTFPNFTMLFQSFQKAWKAKL